MNLVTNRHVKSDFVNIHNLGGNPRKLTYMWGGHIFDYQK